MTDKTKTFTLDAVLPNQTSVFKLYVGGTEALEDATEYTSKCLRASYSKVYLGTHSFNITVDDVNQSNTDFEHMNNVFFIVDVSGTKYLLLKGYIEDISWTNRKRAEIKGKQSNRVVDGSNTMLTNVKVPYGSNQPEFSLGTFLEGIGDTAEGTWYELSASLKDIVGGYSERDLRKE